MPNYAVLLNYTEKGIANIKDSPKRVEAFRAALKAAGGKLESIHLTLGQYDLICIVDAPDDATLARLLLQTASLGNVRTTTLRAFTEAEFEKIVKSL